MSEQLPAGSPFVPGLTKERVIDMVETRQTDKGICTIPVAGVESHEPVVTRRELWSYYCVCYHLLLAVQTDRYP